MKKNIGKIIILLLIILVVTFFSIDGKNIQIKIKEFSIKNDPEKIEVYCEKMSSDFESCKKSSICQIDDPCSTPNSEGMYCWGMGRCAPK